MQHQLLRWIVNASCPRLNYLGPVVVVVCVVKAKTNPSVYFYVQLGEGVK